MLGGLIKTKVTIDSWLHLPIRHPDAEKVKLRLTKPNPKYIDNQRMGFSNYGVPPHVYGYRSFGDELLVPREMVQELSVGSTEVIDKTSRGFPADLGREIKLRSYQVKPVAAMVKELQDFKGATLQAEPGAGKTVAALEIARRLGRKTIVLVHKGFLLNQWVDRIKRFLDVEAGVVWQDRFEVDSPIVVAMAQTLNARRYPPDFYAQFGLTVVDEVHRFSAETFADAVVQFPSTYRLGLTATPKRKDGLEWIFESHIGPVAIKMSIERESPDVYVASTPIRSVNEAQFTRGNGQPDYTKVISFLVDSPARNRAIVDMTVDAASRGRRVVVFSERRKHLEDLAEMFQAEVSRKGINATFGFYIGGQSEEERVMAASRQVLFCTYQLAAEGMDIPELDTCIMATPKRSIIQTVGRIQRTVEGKPKPIVVDFVDDGIGVCLGLYKRRLHEYKTQGWPVYELD